MSRVVAAASSALPAATEAVARASASTRIASILLQPLRWIFLRALPFALSFLYAIVLYLLSAIASVLLVLLAPFLYPLKVLVLRPSLAVLALAYRNRHVGYFASVAVLLGVGLGYLSSLLIRRASRAAASTVGSNQDKSTPRPSIEIAEHRMGGTLYQENSADSNLGRPAAAATLRAGGGVEDARTSYRPSASRQQSGSFLHGGGPQPKEAVGQKPRTGQARAGPDRFASAMRTLADRRNKRSV